jgi:hypothetical protein
MKCDIKWHNIVDESVDKLDPETPLLVKARSQIDPESTKSYRVTKAKWINPCNFRDNVSCDIVEWWAFLNDPDKRYYD